MNYLIKIGALTLVGSILSACGSSDDNPSTDQTPPVDQQAAMFEVRITNLTNAQPLSPVAVMLHQEGFNSFIDGETASPGLELLAEGGMNSDVLSEAQAAVEYVASGSTPGPVPPRAISQPVTLDVPTADLSDLRLSVISMLVHTNDGFTGTNAANISNMAVGDTRTITGPTWDSGTEANDELGAAIPGPDFNGEGFNAVRDDMIDLVRFHGSVVTSENVEFGLATSDLQDRHRFLNPTSRILVTRTQ